jgi:hypothetical protein
MHVHQQSSDPVATIGIDIGKNTFHLVGLDKRGAIVMRVRVSRNQLGDTSGPIEVEAEYRIAQWSPLEGDAGSTAFGSTSF